jgi:hypothetical protein
LWLLVTTTVVHTLLILFALKMEVTRFSEMSVLIKPAWSHILEDGILRSHHCENLKSLWGGYFLTHSVTVAATVNVAPSSLIISTLKMEVTLSSDTLVLTILVSLFKMLFGAEVNSW